MEGAFKGATTSGTAFKKETWIVRCKDTFRNMLQSLKMARASVHSNLGDEAHPALFERCKHPMLGCRCDGEFCKVSNEQQQAYALPYQRAVQASFPHGLVCFCKQRVPHRGVQLHEAMRRRSTIIGCTCCVACHVGKHLTPLRSSKTFQKTPFFSMSACL